MGPFKTFKILPLKVSLILYLCMYNVIEFQVHFKPIVQVLSMRSFFLFLDFPVE